MALNPSTNPTMTGRTTAPDAEFPYGSSKDETLSGVGDGTPYFKARADDIFGMQQALLNLASIVPSGNADNVLVSDYMNSLVELVSGRAFNYDDSGAADAYVLGVRTKQYPIAGYFEGLRVLFPPANTNTGASTANVASLGVVDIKLNGGAINPAAGDLIAGVEIELVYRASPSSHWELVNPQITDLKRETILSYGNYTSGTFTLPNSHAWTDYKEIMVIQRVSTTDVFSSGVYPIEIIGLSSFALRPDIDQADFAEVSRSSATQFAITRGGNDEIALIIGILK